MTHQRPLKSRRKGAVSSIKVNAAEILELQQAARESQNSIHIPVSYAPIIACALWIIIGTAFYSLYDGFGWAIGFYQSVNVGWSIGWQPPITYDDSDIWSKLFSIYHNAVGVMFTGIPVIYIAKELSASKGSWLLEVMKQEEIAKAAETEGIFDDIVAAVNLYFPKVKIIILFVIWALLGVVVTLYIDGWSVAVAADFTLSTLSGAGYRHIPDTSNTWNFALCALYTTTGVPLTVIAIGLFMSFFLENPEDEAIYDKIVADITPAEINFMKMFDIDDGDGTIDVKEFIILTAVRIGSVEPTLIKEFREKFKELDRENSDRISYGDIVVRRNRSKSTESNAKCRKSVLELPVLGDIKISKQVAPHPGASTPDKATAELEFAPPQHPGQILPVCDVSTSSDIGRKEQCGSSEMEKCETKKSDFDDDDLQLENYEDCYEREDVESVDDKDYDEVRAPSTLSDNESGLENGPIPKSNQVSVDTPIVSDRHISKIFKAKELLIQRESSISDGGPLSILCMKIYYTLLSPYAQSFFLWLLWLFVGTMFFSFYVGMTLSRGFYTSVSVGYGIYWQSLDLDAIAKAYSAIHLLLGSAMIGLAMAVIASSLADSKTNWYSDAARIQEMEAAAESEGYADDIVAALKFYVPKYKIHIIFVLYSVFGVAWSCSSIGWSFVDGLYFAWSSMSTGGFSKIPDDSPDWYFVLVGIYTCSGMAVMAVTFGMMAHALMSLGEAAELSSKVNSFLTEEELDMANRIGIDDSDGYLDCSEYIILMLVRIGALRPELLQVIKHRFDDLDCHGTGSISYNDITSSIVPRVNSDVQCEDFEPENNSAEDKNDLV